MRIHPLPHRQRGTTLIEVLVTVVILAFGLLGIGVFQAKSQVGAVESYQRAQAIVLLEDMTARISGNPLNAANYLSMTIGTGDGRPDDCTGLASGAPRDLCEWSKSLRGAAETAGANTKVGAMVGARGCVEQLQAQDATAGVCRPGIYQISVSWQGLHSTAAPSLQCGKGAYGDETNRRTIAVQVTVGLPACS
jgi:type IV pilus assembly protein PilV